MDIYLGNIVFAQVRERLGYELTPKDRELWKKYHNNKADLSGMKSSFHIFDMPPEIHFKGSEARQAIIKMFTPDKLVEPKGKFRVREVR